MLALLALPAVAAAGPKPIFKPKDTPTKTTTPPPSKTTSPPANTSSSSSSSTQQTPIKKPDTSGTGTSGASTAKTPTSRTGADKPQVVVVDVVGRDQTSAEITLPPAATTPKVVAPDPTPLAIVAVGDRIRAHSATTPAWKLALLALLAAAEAFLVVRLVRHRPGGGLSTAS